LHGDVSPGMSLELPLNSSVSMLLPISKVTDCGSAEVELVLQFKTPDEAELVVALACPSEEMPVVSGEDSS
jgi:hypothetical protein